MIVVVLGVLIMGGAWLIELIENSRRETTNNMRVVGPRGASGNLAGGSYNLANLDQGEQGYNDEDEDEDEGMRVFVIGPEGAGKTTFLAALSQFAEGQPDEYTFEPSNLASSNYVVGVLEMLKSRKWPDSNKQETLEVLKWQFGRADDEIHELYLFDYAGQDMREVLTEDDVNKLQGLPSVLRKKIDDSYLLIYLLDMGGLITGSAKDTNENSWFLKTFLSRPEWNCKRRIIVFTKNDKYGAMIDEAGGDLREMILNHRPNGIRESVMRSQLEEIECFAVTSVKAATILEKDGSKPLTEPRFPLEFEGFEPLVEAILSELEDQ